MNFAHVLSYCKTFKAIFLCLFVVCLHIKVLSRNSGKIRPKIMKGQNITD